jgi:hypothetical protein
LFPVLEGNFLASVNMNFAKQDVCLPWTRRERLTLKGNRRKTC